jgi:hypothetical protein
LVAQERIHNRRPIRQDPRRRYVIFRFIMFMPLP